MPGHTPAEAVHNFLDPLHKALSCVTNAVLDWRGGYAPGVVHAVSLNRGQPVRLRARALAIRVAQNYRIVEHDSPAGRWKVSTSAYWYSLEDLDEREVIAYHWHPGRGPVAYPHMHIGPAVRLDYEAVATAHLPTGRVALEQFLRLLIEGFHVEPLRDDWSQVLTETQRGFETYRTWG